MPVQLVIVIGLSRNGKAGTQAGLNEVLFRTVFGPCGAGVDRRGIDDSFKLCTGAAIHHAANQLDIQITHNVLTCQIVPDDLLRIGTVGRGNLHYPVKATGTEKGAGQLALVIGGGEDKDFTALQVVDAGLDRHKFLGIGQIDIAVRKLI